MWTAAANAYRLEIQTLGAFVRQTLRSCVSRGRPVNRRKNVSPTTLSRPPLFAGLPASEFDAWEWRKAELSAFARSLGIPATGPKAAMRARIRSRLAAREVTDARTQRDASAVLNSRIETPPTAAPTIEVRTSLPPAELVPKFFQAAPGVPRAQALAEWYAKRKAAMHVSQR